jgi:ribosomal protein S18 acetylase RimI-like enzyme
MEHLAYYTISKSKFNYNIFKLFKQYVTEINPDKILIKRDICKPDWMPTNIGEMVETIGYVLLNKTEPEGLFIPIGYFLISLFDTQSAYIHSVYISEKFRGKSLCNQMLSPIVSEMSTKKYKLYLSVKKDNIAAVKCYEKLGFVIKQVSNMDKKLYLKMEK